MLTEIVTADWVRDQVFQLRDHAGFPIIMAQPNGVLGADLLPLSLIGCAIWDVVNILRKQRQPFVRFEVDAESERDPEPPWRFRKIELVYRVWGNGVDPKAVERAIRLTEEKYCSVYATLKAAVELASRVEILEAEPGSGASPGREAGQSGMPLTGG
jgi:putative redox protein